MTVLNTVIFVTFYVKEWLKIYYFTKNTDFETNSFSHENKVIGFVDNI